MPTSKLPATLKFALIIALTFFVFISGEVLFISRDDSRSSLNFYKTLAHYSTQLSNPNTALFFINQMFSITSNHYYSNRYPSLTSPKANVNLYEIKSNTQIKNRFNIYLKKVDLDYLVTDDASRFAKIYYELGLIAYQNQSLQLAEDLFTLASYSAPEWSFFYFELANFYSELEDTSQSFRVISRCRSFEFARQYCTGFETEYLDKNQSQPVGFYNQTIQTEMPTLSPGVNIN